MTINKDIFHFIVQQPVTKQGYFVPSILDQLTFYILTVMNSLIHEFTSWSWSTCLLGSCNVRWIIHSILLMINQCSHDLEVSSFSLVEVDIIHIEHHLLQVRRWSADSCWWEYDHKDSIMTNTYRNVVCWRPEMLLYSNVVDSVLSCWRDGTLHVGSNK